MTRSMIAAALLLGLTMTAAAQETRDLTLQPVRRDQLIDDCVARDGLSLCVSPRDGGRDRAKTASRKKRPGSLTRFTRLAGMFMGRVDAADFGPLKVRFKLELQ